MYKNKSFEEEQLKILAVLPQKLKGYTKDMFQTELEYEAFESGYRRCVSDLKFVFAKTINNKRK